MAEIKPIAFASTIEGVKTETLDKFKNLVNNYKNVDKESLFSFINLDKWDTDKSGTIDTESEFTALKTAVDKYVNLDKEDKKRLAANELKTGPESEYIKAISQDVQDITTENGNKKVIFLKKDNYFEWINDNSIKQGKIDINDLSVAQILCAIKSGTLDIKDKKTFAAGFWGSDNDAIKFGQLVKKLSNFAKDIDFEKQLHYETYWYGSWDIFYAKKDGLAKGTPYGWKVIDNIKDVHPVYTGTDVDIGGQLRDGDEILAFKNFADELYKHINEKREKYGFEKFPY